MRLARLVVAAGAWVSAVSLIPAIALGIPSASPRLDPATAAEVERIVEAARSDGLPTAPLRSKALEGAAKGSAAERIVAVVRAHAGALAEARTALGASSADVELEAGAAALLVGVPADSLARLRGTRPGRSVVVPLVVIADLVARRVPAPAAVTAVLLTSRAGVADADLLRMRSRVERDIAAGVAPANAVHLRARSLAVRAGATPTGREPPRPARPEHRP